MVGISAGVELSDLDDAFHTYVHKSLETRDKWPDQFCLGDRLMTN